MGAAQMKPTNARKLYVRPVELKEANTLIAKWHRHHKPVIVHKFSIGCFDQETNKAVGVCGEQARSKND